MSRYANKTSTIRWQDETNYSQAWIDRGKCLMQLFLKQEFNGNLNYKISEFGCGPYAPISKFCKDAPSFKVYKSDIKKWDLETKIVDLNSCPDIDVTDISVLSGVLEYLNDLEITSKNHE